MSKTTRTTRTTIILPRAARILIAIAIMALMLMTNIHPSAQEKSQDKSSQDRNRLSIVKPGRSVVRSRNAMVATSQPLASQVGIEVLKRGGNAVDAAIAMAAMLNVTEPMMTGVGGDCFAMIYSPKTKKIEALNASGRCPRALTLDHFTSRKIAQMPLSG